MENQFVNFDRYKNVLGLNRLTGSLPSIFSMLYITEKYEIANKYCDKVYQLLAHGHWFSPVTPASSIINM